MIIAKEEWKHEDHQSSRWVQAFALFPVRTFDHGWIWLKTYWRYQKNWGWGFSDDFPYLVKKRDG